MQGNDLGGAMISLVRGLDPALMGLIAAACYLLALLAFVQGCARLLRLSEDRFNGPSGAGTALCFLVCVVMASFPSWLAAGGESLFGQGNRSLRQPRAPLPEGRRLRRADRRGAQRRGLGRAAGLPARRIRAARGSGRGTRRERRAGRHARAGRGLRPGTSRA